MTLTPTQVSAIGHGSDALTVFSVSDGARLSVGSLLDEHGEPREKLQKGGTLHSMPGSREGQGEALLLASKCSKRVEVLVPSLQA